jgi:hypothetical protein
VRDRQVRASRAAALALSLLALAGCPDPADQFIAGRLLDRCNGTWPVCTTIAGCVVNNTIYLEGTLPGTRRMIVRTRGQATIKVSLYLKSEGATGTNALIEWNETNCGTVASASVGGPDFFREFDAEGVFSRTQNVSQEGDHLITFSSDATADYYVKLDVTEIGI